MSGWDLQSLSLTGRIQERQRHVADVSQLWLYFKEDVILKPRASQRGEGSRADYFESTQTHSKQAAEQIGGPGDARSAAPLPVRFFQ
jgi:hypothetical protein